MFLRHFVEIAVTLLSGVVIGFITKSRLVAKTKAIEQSAKVDLMKVLTKL